MGKNSGGSGTGGGGGAAAREMASKYLGNIKNPALKKALAETMADFDKEFGVPKNLTIETKDIDAMGQVNGRNRMQLSKDFENGKLSTAEAKRTMAHELAHTIDRTDNSRSGNVEFKGTKVVLKSENKTFERKLSALYKHFKQHSDSKAAKQIGDYARTNKHEFFAEAISKHLTGTQNGYTKAVYELAKSMTK